MILFVSSQGCTRLRLPESLHWFGREIMKNVTVQPDEVSFEESVAKKRYALGELLAQCAPNSPVPSDMTARERGQENE